MPLADSYRQADRFVGGTLGAADGSGAGHGRLLRRPRGLPPRASGVRQRPSACLAPLSSPPSLGRFHGRPFVDLFVPLPTACS